MMSELFSLENLQEVAHQYGYWAVFLGIALENTGIPIPGETITIIGGFFAGSGELNYWWVLGSAISGAVLGDNFGYLLGRLGGWSLLLRLGNFFRIPEKQLETARVKFLQNAPQAVFFGRFITLLRIFAGPMAGIVQMPYLQFALCNLGGAAVWALIIVTLSFFLGRVLPLQQLIEIFTRFSVLGLGLLLVWIIASFWWKSRQGRLIAKE